MTYSTDSTAAERHALKGISKTKWGGFFVRALSKSEIVSIIQEGKRLSEQIGGRSFRAFLTSCLIYDRGCGMPRLARLDAPGVLHHVMGRGMERKNIFWNDKDRSDFIDRLAGVVEKGAGIYSRTGTPVK
jgi:hypothetical protein